MVSQPRLFAIVPAAGSGSRMGAAVSKVFLPVGSETVIQRSVRILSAAARFEQIVVLASQEDESAMRQALARSPGAPWVARGGETRQASVSRGLAMLSESASPAGDDIVLIHDAARCFVTPEVVGRCISGAIEHGAVTAGFQIVDSLLRADGKEQAMSWVDREGMWAVQTPQAFRFALLSEAHRRAAPGATDDASLVASLHPVTVVPGARENIKITVPADYEFARRYLIPRSALGNSLG